MGRDVAAARIGGVSSLLSPLRSTGAGADTPAEPQRTAARALAVPAVVLGALIVVSTLIRAWVGLRGPTPWINADEVVYSELGRSLYGSGHFEILGQPTRFYSFVYPALVGGPLSFSDLELGYRLLKVVQALVMSLTCVPVYLWSRALMPRRWALAAAALTLTLPGLAYSGLVMTEVAFLPLGVLAAWAMARALAEPSRRRQLLAAAAIVLAAATRLQAIVLLPVFALAIVLYGTFSGGLLRAVRAQLVSFGVLGGVAVAWSAAQLARGGPATNVLGAYRAAGETSYGLASIARFATYHAADVLLLTAVLPVCATAVVVARAARGGERSPHVNAFAAVVVAHTAVFVLEVGTFASRQVGRLAERDLLVLAPLFLIGFALWLSRDAPVAWAEALPIGGAAVALLAYLPVQQLVTRGAIPDAFTLAPLYQLGAHVPRVNLDLFVLNIGVPLLALFAFPPRRRLWIAAACVGALLAGTSVSASVAVEHESRFLQPQLLGPSSRWIDDNARGDVTYLYAGESRWNAVYENVFWNHRIDRVDDIGSFVVPGPVPQTPVGPRQDALVVGKLGVPEHARYVVASTSLMPFGTKIADAGSADLALWRIAPPFRLGFWITGMDVQVSSVTPRGSLHTSGDVGSSVRLVAYRCSRDLLQLTLRAVAPATIALSSDGQLWTRRRVRAWKRTTFVVPSDRGTRERQTLAAHAGRSGGLAAGTPPMRQCAFDLVSTAALRIDRLDVVRHT